MLLYLYYNNSSVVQVEDIVIEEDKNRITHRGLGHGLRGGICVRLSVHLWVRLSEHSWVN